MTFNSKAHDWLSRDGVHVEHIRMSLGEFWCKEPKSIGAKK